MDTDMNPDAGQQGGTGDASAKTRAWANKVGYKPSSNSLKPSLAKKRNVFSELGQMQSRTSAPTLQTAPIVTGPPLQIDVTNTQGIVMKKALKGSSDKKTCVVAFGGKSLVLKGGSGDAADHVLATEFIGKLGLRGVRVPASRLLDGAEKQALVAHFRNGDMHGREMADSLTAVQPDGSTTGQLSEQANGVPPEKLFLSKSDQANLDDGIKRREDLVTQQLAKDEAWTATYTELITRMSGSLSKPGVIERATSTDRTAALKWLRENFFKDQQIRMIDLLEEIEADQVAQGLAKMKADTEALDQPRKDLKAFAASTAGVEAFAGVAAADLVSGMDDRIMTKFNGGNFLFDSDTNELVCIDNSKNPQQSLSADVGNWKASLNGTLSRALTLEDAIYERIYGTGPYSSKGSSGAPSNYVTFDDQQAAAAKDTIRLTLAKVITSIEADTSQGNAARERAAFMKARMGVDDLFRPPLPEPPTKPVKLGAGDKFARASKSFFTPNKKDKRVDTQAIKEQLRAGTITAAEARQKLQALELLKPSLANDHRSKKILFLAGVAEYCETLQGLAKDLKTLLDSVPDLLSDGSAKTASQKVRASVMTWRTALAGDKKMLALIDAAWSEFPLSMQTD